MCKSNLQTDEAFMEGGTFLDESAYTIKTKLCRPKTTFSAVMKFGKIYSEDRSDF